jgi:hypothetical protein
VSTAKITDGPPKHRARSSGLITGRKIAYYATLPPCFSLRFIFFLYSHIRWLVGLPAQVLCFYPSYINASTNNYVLLNIMLTVYYNGNTDLLSHYCTFSQVVPSCIMFPFKLPAFTTLLQYKFLLLIPACINANTTPDFLPIAAARTATQINTPESYCKDSVEDSGRVSQRFLLRTTANIYVLHV